LDIKILLAPDSFKESLPANEVCHFLKKGIHSVDRNLKVVTNPVSDGGEGILEVLVEAKHGEIIETRVSGPLGVPVTAKWGMIEDKGSTAIIEIAEAAGLMLIPVEERNPLETSTYGVGQLVLEALDKNVGTIIIGLGGSATNDGGTGMLRALGFELLNNSSQEIPEGNAGLKTLASIDERNVNPRLEKVKFIVASDVTNPLTGPEGATFTYGTQKGGSVEDLKIMEQNMIHFAKVIRKTKGIDVNTIAGSGAAGGLGAALVAFLGAEIRSGFGLVSGMTKLEDKIKSADIVITGEGKLDSQTLMGKAPAGVAELAHKHGKFLIGIGGIIDTSASEQLADMFDLILPISRKPLSKKESISRAGKLLEETGDYIINLIQNGKILL